MAPSKNLQCHNDGIVSKPLGMTGVEGQFELHFIHRYLNPSRLSCREEEAYHLDCMFPCLPMTAVPKPILASHRPAQTFRRGHVALGANLSV